MVDEYFFEIPPIIVMEDDVSNALGPTVSPYLFADLNYSGGKMEVDMRIERTSLSSGKDRTGMYTEPQGQAMRVDYNIGGVLNTNGHTIAEMQAGLEDLQKKIYQLGGGVPLPSIYLPEETEPADCGGGFVETLQHQANEFRRLCDVLRDTTNRLGEILK